jgi:ABC-2 type transport system ATP-binding protein
LSESVVHVSELTKVFKVPEREPGLRAAAKALVRRKTRDVHAVEAISFDIEPGEVVGFLGPNGAGRTTTLKMLAGLLYPTSGEARVLGHVPSRREKDYLRRMTMVMGNRNQLQWDIPALDSFELYRAIYRLRREDYLAMRDELVELLDVGDYPRWLRYSVTFLVPVAFAVTVPAEALTSRLEWPTLVLSVGFGVVLFAFSRWFWRFGLRNYSGASA